MIRSGRALQARRDESLPHEFEAAASDPLARVRRIHLIAPRAGEAFQTSTLAVTSANLKNAPPILLKGSVRGLALARIKAK